MSDIIPLTYTALVEITSDTPVGYNEASDPHNRLLQNTQDNKQSIDNLNSDKVEISDVVYARGTQNTIPKRNTDGTTIDVDITGDAKTLNSNDSSVAKILNTIPVRDESGKIYADIEGDVTGNVSGNLTGNVSGNVAGNVTGDLTGNADSATTLSAGNDRDTVDALQAPAFAPFGTTAGTVAEGNHTHISVPAGAFMWFCGSSAPEGYLVADGSEISRTIYSDLYAAIGVIYGSGNGSTTFNLPDMRAMFVRGIDSGRDVDTDRELGSFQECCIESHRHQVNMDNKDNKAANTGGQRVGEDDNAKYGINVWSTYTGEAETRPKNIAFLPCIKY